jgi:hypothetical protein
MKEGHYAQPDPRDPPRTNPRAPDPADPASWNALFARVRKLESRVSELEHRQPV